MADSTQKKDELFLKHLGLLPEKKIPGKTPAPAPIAAPSKKVSFQNELGKYLSPGQLASAAKKDSVPQKRASAPKPDPSHPEVVLDLHHLTVAKAMSQIHWTIERMLHARQKTLLVITGKGLHSQNGPVLKNEVVHFLSHSPKVRSFRSAPVKLGGSGAQLVEIKPEE